MSKILYITANPNPVSQSYSLSVGEAFVTSYKESHPDDEVIHIDLFKEDIPQIDADVFGGWGKLRSGQGFETLTSEETTKVARLNEIVEKFVSADKYVFVTPLWNLSFPPVVKSYIDAVSVAGKTFKYTEQGPVGLLGTKKALHIQASGGTYSEGPAAVAENGHRYIRTILQFMGVTEIDAIFVEGVSQFPERAKEIKEAAIQKAQALATTF